MMIRPQLYLSLLSVPIRKLSLEYNFSTVSYLTLTIHHNIDGVAVVGYEPKTTCSMTFYFGWWLCCSCSCAVYVGRGCDLRIPQIQILCCRTTPKDRLVALQQTPLSRVQVPAPPSPRPLLDRVQVQPGK